jgi:hypothetical protein
MINIERRLYCWNNFRILREVNTSQGGITHVLIPGEASNKEELRKFQSKPELDTVLLKQNIKHFSQAHGPPLTVSPLTDIVGEDGCTDQTLKILEAIIPDGLPKE